jgi:hypothetical protein
VSAAPPAGAETSPVDTQAACLVIGDEILTGKIHEQNAHTLSKVLFERGVQLRRIEVIPDDVDEIAHSVRALAKRFDLVGLAQAIAQVLEGGGGGGPGARQLELRAVDSAQLQKRLARDAVDGDGACVEGAFAVEDRAGEVRVVQRRSGRGGASGERKGDARDDEKLHARPPPNGPQPTGCA